MAQMGASLNRSHGFASTWWLLFEHGIFSGMNSYPSPDRVVGDLGDKFVSQFVHAVNDARTDLAEFREWQPGWFSMFTGRFTANFIHERVWASMVRRVEGQPGVDVVDSEPTREIYTTGYVVRFKRHHPGDKISTYPTEGALRFWTNGVTLPGLGLCSLAMGYMWDAEQRQMVDAVMSFRDGKDKPVWAITLTEESGGASAITWAPIAPNLPEFDLSQVVAEGARQSEGEV